METVPVRRATSVPLQHHLRTDSNSTDRDTTSVPILQRNTSATNASIPSSDSVARTSSRGSSSIYQIGNYKVAPKRPSDTTLPSVSRDTKTQIRTPLLANRIGLPAFRRPHSNPNLTNEKRTYTSSGSSGNITGTNKLELEPELSRNSKSAQNVMRFNSAPVAPSILPIPSASSGIHGFNTLTSTPNEEPRTVADTFQTQELTASIIPRSADGQNVMENTVNEMRTVSDFKFQLEPKPDYLQLIQNLLASKKSNFTEQNDTSDQSDLTPDSVTNFSSDVAQIVDKEILSNLSSLSDLGVEVANQIRSGSDSGASTQRHISSGSLGGKSTSVAAAETVLEALRYNPRHIPLNQSETNLRVSLHPSTEMRHKSTPSVNVSRATREPPDTFPQHKPSESTRESSAEIVKEDSFQILTDQTANIRNGPMRSQPSAYTYTTPPVAHFERKTDAHSSNQMSSSSSASFIKLNTQLSQDTDSPQETDSPQDTNPTEDIDTSPTETNNKQTNQLVTLSPPTLHISPDNNIEFPRFAFSDFITPTNPFVSSTFLTEMDSQLSLPSVQPHTQDFETTLAPLNSNTNIQTHPDGGYPIESVPSHYKIDLSKDDFMPLTPSELRPAEDTSLNRELEIVSLPQSSVVSPSKLNIDTTIDESIVFEDKNVGTNFDIQNETSFEYIQRFVSEVKKFMEKRTFQIPQNVSKEATIPVPPGDTTATPPLPSNLDQLITDLARQKLDELWENYLHNKSEFSDKPRLTRRHNKVAHAPPDNSTLTEYNTKPSSSFSDTTLFVPRHNIATHRRHLVLKPRNKKTHKRRKDATTFVTSLATQTQPTFDNELPPDSLELSVKQNSVAFLVPHNRDNCVDREEPLVSKSVSADLTLQEACKSFNPRFITNSNCRQVELQEVRMCRREMARMCLVPTENKSIQTQSTGKEANHVGKFIQFRRKLTHQEIQNQNKRWRSRFPDRRRRDTAHCQRERGRSMRARVKTYQKEIIDPVRKTLPQYRY